MIEIRHLQKAYPASTPLKDVNADIQRGDVIAVIGPSGTGKSTLLRCINLLETPTSGSIRIDGQEILKPGCNVNLVRRKVGMVFQSFNLFGHMTAIENIMRPQMDLLGRGRQEAYDRGIGMLRQVGLVRQALNYPDELSGGQKQRVAIARTLVMEPEIILFDEPTSALDPAMAGEVQAVIRGLAAAGKTMVIVTHEMGFARSISNRVFYMDRGEIYEEGTPDEIFTRPQRELTRRFIYKLKVLEVDIEGDAFDFPGVCTQIADYCGRNQIPPRTSLRLQRVFEELIGQIMISELRTDKIRFRVEHTEADEKTEVIVEYSGEAFDPEQIENRLSMKVLESAISGIRCEAYPGEAADQRICMCIRP